MERDEIIFGADETVQPRRKVFLTDESKRQLSSVISDAMRGKMDVVSLGLEFPYCHPVSLYEELLGAAAPGDSDTIIDYFAGSGTTAHAVTNLNREDGGNRKYILVEMANYFDNVLLPRIKKVVFSDDWKDGKPQNSNGIRHFLKYHCLEQYEDSLDNLELAPDKTAQKLFGDDYLLKYFLDFETKDNPSLLNIEHLKKPFSYKLKVNLEEVGEPQEVVVDIPETFHYLLGLKVNKVKVRKNKGKKYLFTLGEKENRTIAVVWREYDDEWTPTDFKKDKEFIIEELGPWSPQIVYVNGQNVLTPTFGDHVVEIRSIEPEFKRLMEG
jgi:adenine-specific DNA-methyltransferase